jgi:hypothetical protein
MDAWLAGRFTIFGIPGQYWMLAVDVIFLVSIAIALWRRT